MKIHLQILAILLMGIPVTSGRGDQERRSVKPLIQAQGGANFANWGNPLGSEEQRKKLGLSDEQEGRIKEILEQSAKLWSEHLAKASVVREEQAKKALKQLDESQIMKLRAMQEEGVNWFRMILAPVNLREIDLSEEARTKIEEIAKDLREKRMKLYGAPVAVSPEQRANAKELQKKYRELMEEARRESKEILTEKQFDELRKVVARSQFQSMHLQSRYREQLGISDEQIQKLNALTKKRAEASRELAKIDDPKKRIEEWNKWRETSGQEAFGVLNDEQRKKLSNLTEVEAMWFSALAWPGLKENLDLSDRQEEKLKGVMERLRSQRTAAFRPDPKRAERLKEMQAKNAEMEEEARVQVRELISDEQFRVLVDRSMNTQLPYIYARADMLERLSLTEHQIRALKDITAEGRLQARAQTTRVLQERKKLQQQAEEILTKPQRKKLEELNSRRPSIQVQGLQRELKKK